MQIEPGQKPPRRLRLRPTRRKARAAIKAAKVDFIDWLSSLLAAPPSTAAEGESQLIQDLGDLVSTKVFAALCEAAGENQRKVRAEFARNHLFCTLLAATACAMQQVSDDLNKITTAVAGSRAFVPLARAVADLAGVPVTHRVIEAPSRRALRGTAAIGLLLRSAASIRAKTRGHRISLRYLRSHIQGKSAVPNG